MTVRASEPPLAGEAVLVVIPTYNERENITRVVAEIMALDARYRVLVVDDSSPDGTADVVRNLRSEYPGRVELLLRPKKAGIGRAYVQGLQMALATEAPVIAQMDADHSHAPDDLARLVAAIPGRDLVLASRYIPGGKTVGWPWHRTLISRVGGFYARTILGVPIRDLTGGFKVWRRETLERIDLASIRSDGYCFQIETTYRALNAGADAVEVPVVFHDRVAGKSKLSRRVVIEAVFMVWTLRFRQMVSRRR